MLNQQSREHRLAPSQGAGAVRAPLAHLAWLICSAARQHGSPSRLFAVKSYTAACGSGRQSRRRLAACLSCSEALGYSVPLVSPLCLPERSLPFMPCSPRDMWERLRHRPCVCQTPSQLNLHLPSQVNLRKLLISCVPSTLHANLLKHHCLFTQLRGCSRPTEALDKSACQAVCCAMISGFGAGAVILLDSRLFPLL